MGAFLALFALPLLQHVKWEPKPDWLRNPAERWQVERKGPITGFKVTSLGRGMKWWASIPPRLRVDFSLLPYLLVEYRARNVNTSHPDYAIYLFVVEGKGGTALYLRELEADGRWHRVVVDLGGRLPSGIVRWIAVQVQAGRKALPA
ncbi:MAG TPA: hypothetical protein EYP65_03915, partial [Armatimonadetes bacterium]|nr:hypothetical protein [Armatimonadota bacterium]